MIILRQAHKAVLASSLPSAMGPAKLSDFVIKVRFILFRAEIAGAGSLPRYF